jgi:hypothetical protein
MMEQPYTTLQKKGTAFMEQQPRLLPTDRLGFYIASGDQDILSQVNRLMQRSGYIGVMDTAGRMQYIVDGRKGGPYAARRILEMTGQILRERDEADLLLRQYLGQAADQVLAQHAIRKELKGCRFLRCLLLEAGLDESRLHPISKTLYPIIARHFRVSASQIERDIRYALIQTDFHEQGLTNTAAISRLYDEMVRCAEDLQRKEMPSGHLHDAGGHL